MEEMRYYDRLAAARIRGMAVRTGKAVFDDEILLRKELSELTQQETERILEAGKQAGEKLYAFKSSHSELPRVKRVLGFLKSLQFESLLDVGSGRGVFLFPFLEEFPWVQVTSLDLLPHRVEVLQDLTRGGITRLQALEGDICTTAFPEKSVDVVTMLEVLEHIPDVEKAVASAVRIAGKHVVVTVPSKEDNNPEHIHLLTKEVLTELFEGAGCRRLRFDGVNGHLFLVATV